MRDTASKATGSEAQRAAPAKGVSTCDGRDETGQATLDEIVRRLADEFHPERISLLGSPARGTRASEGVSAVRKAFGSPARGDTTAHSDYDVMVIVAKSDGPPHRRAPTTH